MKFLKTLLTTLFVMSLALILPAAAPPRAAPPPRAPGQPATQAHRNPGRRPERPRQRLAAPSIGTPQEPA